MQKKLYKSDTDKAIFGVCGGFAEYFGIDSLIIRLVLVLFSLAYGSGIVFYIIAALVMPKKPEGYDFVNEEPGYYNAGGTVYVNRASVNNSGPAYHAAESTAESVIYAQPPKEEAAESAAPADPAEAEVPVAPEEPAEAEASIEAAKPAETKGSPEAEEQVEPEEPAATKESTPAESADFASPKEEPIEEPVKQEEPPKAQPGPQAEPKKAEEAEPRKTYAHSAQASQAAYNTHNTQGAQTSRSAQSGQYYAPQKPASSAVRTRLLIGVILMAIGAITLLRVLMPWVDTRIVFGILLLVIGFVLIIKKE